MWRPAQTTSEPFRIALAGTESIWRCSVEFAVRVRVHACVQACICVEVDMYAQCGGIRYTVHR